MSSGNHGSIEELRALIAFVDAGSVSAAAGHLGCGQPMMSRRLSVFQSSDPVLRRRGRSLELTARGKRVLPAIRALVRQYDHVAGYLEGTESTPRTLSIGTGGFAAEHYLPSALSELRRKLPDWDLQMSILRGRQRIARVVGGSLDLAVVSHDPVQIQAVVDAEFGEDMGLDMRPLASHALCVVALSDSPQGRELEQFPAGKAPPLSKLCDWPLLGLDASSGVRRQIERRLASRGKKLHFAVEGGGWHAAKSCVLEGLGVAVLPWVLVRDHSPEVLIVRRLPNAIRIRDYLISRREPDDALVDLVPLIERSVKAQIARQVWAGPA